MFVCVDCHELFEDPAEWEETHGLDHGPYEKWSGCPYCHGSYVEAHRCNCCDEWIDGNYIKTEDDRRYCTYCYKTMEIGDEE